MFNYVFLFDSKYYLKIQQLREHMKRSRNKNWFSLSSAPVATSIESGAIKSIFIHGHLVMWVTNHTG